MTYVLTENMDIRMPQQDGLAAVRMVQERLRHAGRDSDRDRWPALPSEGEGCRVQRVPAEE